MLVYADLSSQVLGAAIEVHRVLGPGMLESTYEHCLCHELPLRGVAFRRQVDCPVEHKGTLLDCGYRIDLLIEDCIILELKAIEKILPVHEAQLLSYLRLTGKKLGFLINFHSLRLKDGIVRRVL